MGLRDDVKIVNKYMLKNAYKLSDLKLSWKKGARICNYRESDRL